MLHDRMMGKIGFRVLNASCYFEILIVFPGQRNKLHSDLPSS